MKTADQAQYLALYASACCEDEMIFASGDLFSRCLNCNRATEWRMVERVMSWQELDERVADNAPYLLAA